MTETATQQIYKSMSAIMAEAPAVAKTEKNKDQGFMFRGIDQVYSALHGIMAKHKVFASAEILSVNRYQGATKSGTAFVDHEVMIRYTFHAEDGSFVSTDSIGLGRDYADKSASKAMAIAHKYALVQIFCIPTNEPDNDPDATTIQGVGAKHEPSVTAEQENEISELMRFRDVPADKLEAVTRRIEGITTEKDALAAIKYLKTLPLKEEYQ